MSLTLNDLRVRTGDIPFPFRPASLADLVEVLKQEGAVELEWCDWHDSPSHGVGMVFCDLVLEKREPDHKCLMSKRLVLPLGDTP